MKKSLLLVLLLAALPLLAANPVPAISEPLFPTHVAPGSSSFTLTVNGTGFVSGTVVNWNRVARQTTFVSSSRVTAQITGADVANAGTASVSVVNPGPGGGASNVAFFSVTLPTKSIAVRRDAISVPNGGVSIVAGDFNNDGRVDTATLGSFHKQISLVISGNVSPHTYELGVGLPGGQPIQVAVGDFNGDGKLDLVAAAGPVWVLLGNGDGSFQAPVEYLEDSLSGQVVVRDINGDGTLDLVFGSQSADGMNPVLLGNGDGTFRAGTSYAGGTHIAALAAADFNGDGLVDLAVVPDPIVGEVCVELGNGDGTFVPGLCAALAPGISVRGMTVADFNGDGKPDLAITPGYIALGNGDGTFSISANTLWRALWFTAADVNGDGFVDLVFTDPRPLVGLQISLGDGSGHFNGVLSFTFPSSTRGIAVADMDGDGRLDFIGVRGALDFQAPAVTLSTKTLAFPTTKIGSASAPKSVTVTNSGSADLAFTGIATNSADFSETSDCPSIMAVGSSCSVSVVFTPSIIGLETAVLTISDNAHFGFQSVNLHGKGK